MLAELLKIAGQCDGVRCDMAMLVLPEVFERTWGRAARPFWPTAVARVREKAPGFTFMAEVYWDLEWTLQQQGFDYAYDKRLYDRLREGDGPPGSRALPRRARLPGQARPLPREPRRAARGGDVRFASPPRRGSPDVSLSWAALLPPGAARGAQEPDLAASRPRAPPNRSTRSFALSTSGSSACCACRRCATDAGSSWSACRPGRATRARKASSRSPGKDRRGSGCSWRSTSRRSRLNATCACRSRTSAAARGGFRTGSARPTYERDGDDLQARGLFLDEPPWQALVFSLTPGA